MSPLGKTPISAFRLPPALKARAVALAHADGLTLTDAVIEALIEWCRRQERSKR